MLDGKAMKDKHRRVSKDNPFEEKNKLGPEYHVPEYILDKPGYIQNINQFKSDKPLAGRFGELGAQIFEVGPKKAG